MLTLFLSLQPEQCRSCLIFPGFAWSEVSTGVKCKKRHPLCSVKYPAAGVSSYTTPHALYRIEQRFPWALRQWNFHGRARCDLRGSMPQRWAPAPAAMHYLKTLIQSRLQGTPFVTLSEAVSVTRLRRRLFCIFFASWWSRAQGRPCR